MNEDNSQRLGGISLRIREILALLPAAESNVLTPGVTPPSLNLKTMNEERKLRDELDNLYDERKNLLLEGGTRG